MPSFAGFPDGLLASVRVPDLFFSELLPAIDSLAELKVTLHLIWLSQRRATAGPAVSQAELERDGVLRAGLGAAGLDPDEGLREGLRKALERGTLLRLPGAGGGPAWYLLNTEEGRTMAERIRAGEVSLPEADLAAEEQPLPQKPTIFALYEQNIGPLQPIIAEELEEAERTYPPEWIEAAFREAARSNARQWRYVRRVLERWQRQGRDDTGLNERRDRRRYLSGEYEQYRRS